MTLYEKIKGLAEEQGMTLKDLEREAKLGNGTIAKWKTSSPSVATLKKVTDVLKINIGVLL